LGEAKVYTQNVALFKMVTIGYAMFTDYTLPVSFFILLMLSWFMILHSIGMVFEQYSWGVPYTFFSIIAWVSLFVLI